MIEYDFNIVSNDQYFDIRCDVEYGFRCCVEELIFQRDIECRFRCCIEELIFLYDSNVILNIDFNVALKN